MTEVSEVWAYVSSAWRRWSSDSRTESELVELLEGKGYLTSPFNRGVKPANPNARDVRIARGLKPEVEETYSD